MENAITKLEIMNEMEVSEVIEVNEVSDDSLASENFATKPTAKVTSITSSEAITSKKNIFY